MDRIDLTLNRDFHKKPEPRSNIFKSKKQPLIMQKKTKYIITKRCVQNNFLTGSFKDINNNRMLLRIYRHIDEVDKSCEKCGGLIVFNKSSLLCDVCEREMNNLFKKEAMLFKIFS